ncbi:CBS domain-containing protein [Fontimonas sp. SYSU GA230001]|uniref:CBS domain-containing protein n=1 Tax=Fontimonas sp. SYSU GA230001 TaxID=3142450 RepID=UPI0032B4428A
MRVGECCNRSVVVCDRRASIHDAARMMRQFNNGTVVVVDRAGGGKRPLGIVTDRDLVFEVLARQHDPEQMCVEQLLADELPTAQADDGFWETLERMRTRGFRRIAVVDRNGDLVGLLAIDDVLDLLSDAQRRVVELARPSPAAERSYLSGAARPPPNFFSPGVAEWARVA